MKMVRLESLIQDNFKGITPSYVDNGSIIVLNQKCIRNNTIDYSFARFHNPIKEFSNKKVVQVGDILINSTGVGTAGRCAFVRELPENKTVITDSHILTIRIADFYQAGCIEYLLFGMEKILQTYMDGSTGQGEFDKQRLYNIEIPEFKKPKFIYEFLTNLENKITLNNQINTQLEQMAKTLYDYWFVQFDFPNQDGKPYKSSGGKMVYNETLKREIPEGWEVGVLSDIANIKKGTLITEKTANTNGNIKVVSAGIDFSYYHDTSNYPKNTITISASGANAGFINFWQEPIFACDCTAITTDNIGKTIYVLNFLYQNQQYIYKQARGSAQPHVYPKDIETLSIVKPNQIILENFTKIIGPLNERISVSKQQTQQLTQLRDFLLPMLMNGQVGVGDD